MGVTKRHHYVPVFYLKRFSKDNKRLNAIIINSCKEKIISVKDACCSENFYTIKEKFLNPGHNSLSIEKEYFAKNEEVVFSNFLESFDDIETEIKYKHLDKIEFVISENDRLVLSDIIGTLYMRGPRIRKISDCEAAAMKNIMEIAMPQLKIDYDPSLYHAQNFYANENLCIELDKWLANNPWLFRYSENGNFMTSDNPICIIDHSLMKEHKYFAKAIIGAPHTALFFSLSPHLLLEIYDKDEFPDSIELNNKLTRVKKCYEDIINGYQFLNAEELIFSYTGDFSQFKRNKNNG